MSLGSYIRTLMVTYLQALIFSNYALVLFKTQLREPFLENLIVFSIVVFFFSFLRPSQHLIRSGPGKPNQRKVSSRTFRRGIPEQKFNVNRVCFPKEKHQNSQKWAKFMNFSFWPFLWFGWPGRLLT